MDAFKGLADWYYDWMTHPAYDPWWDWAELTNKYERVSAAVLNLSGWHDEAYGPAGATTNFAGLVRARGGNAVTARTHLVVGPWTHGIGPISRTKSGERDMGAAAALNYDELVLNWMDKWVKGVDNGVDREPPVRVYAMGAGAVEDREPLAARGHGTLTLSGGWTGGAGTKAGRRSLRTSPPLRPAPTLFDLHLRSRQSGARSVRGAGRRP